MRSAAAQAVSWLALVALPLACSSPPPPQPPPPPPPKVEAPPPPEKPKPKPCVALDENCVSESGTKAKIAGSSLAFEPVAGWTYAQEEDGTLAQLSDSGPALTIQVHEAGDAKTADAKNDAALQALAKRLGITLPKKKVRWKKPAQTKEIGALKMSFWQLEGAVRADKKGPLLLFGAPLEDGKALLGLGFVPDDDSSSADVAIEQSVDSIGVFEAPP